MAHLNGAEIKRYEGNHAEKEILCNQWEIVDLIYSVGDISDDPFAKKAYAVVTGEEGIQRIPLFYNDDNEWVFRYSSAAIGRKSFVLESDIEELDGKTSFLSWGPIQIRVTAP